MSSRSKMNIVVALFPLLLFLRMNGQLLFWVDKIKTKTKIKYLEKCNVVICTYQILFMCYAVKDLLQFVEMASHGTIMDMVYVVVFYMTIGSIVFVNYFVETLRNGKLLKLLQNFYTVDKFLRRNNIHLDYKKIRNYSTLIIALEATCYIYFHFLTIQRFWLVGLTNIQLGFLFVYYYGVHMMQVSMTAKTYTLFAIIDNIYYHINKKIEHSDLTVELISTSRIIYYNVYELVLELNQVLAIQLVVPFSVTFVMVIFHIYYEAVTASDITMLIWSATILTKIMLVIVQIEKTVLSANRVKQTIVKSSMTKDKLVKREINMFLLQLLHQKINISGAKLFVINTRMIPYVDLFNINSMT
nr:PREDICTED: uncharacterized protein LOC107398324 isoform X2 [Tribolium castaneum]|eukprot:XP_015837560.1 PREDICTED: uncharacterized protein LOC107398324 isoform X2 [Tribolium castaneum]